jgi:succinyl-CoA synthetase beta subunit
MSRLAYNHDLKYVDLNGGNIGLISNGAALCLATNDLLEEMGGKPTNFLDIQSGESEALDDILNAI